jgi:hypothetical protein
MRKLQTHDVFKLARIIKHAHLKESISQFIKRGKEEGANTEEIGIDVFMMIIESCGDAKLEDLLYDLLAGIAEKKQDEIKTQSLDTTIKQIQEIIKENNIVTFFNTASHLTT